MEGLVLEIIRAVLLITILHECHPFPGFVYRSAKFSHDKNLKAQFGPSLPHSPNPARRDTSPQLGRPCGVPLFLETGPLSLAWQTTRAGIWMKREPFVPLRHCVTSGRAAVYHLRGIHLNGGDQPDNLSAEKLTCPCSKRQEQSPRLSASGLASNGRPRGSALDDGRDRELHRPFALDRKWPHYNTVMSSSGPEAVVRGISAKIALMVDKLKTLQNPDGGFKAFYCHDITSGVWATAEIVHLAAKVATPADSEGLQLGCRYLIASQNADGGWPFRRGGKSITDITAWCVLALSHFGHLEALKKGVDFILLARNNEGSSQNEAGWGLTSFEEDRVYSTWIASYCLQRLLANQNEQFPPALMSRARAALKESKEWLLQAMNMDDSWAPTTGATPHITSTTVALLTLFMQGEDPRRFANSYTFLKTGLRSGLWRGEDEIVVTREGYELTQQWFTSALAFRAMIFFA